MRWVVVIGVVCALHALFAWRLAAWSMERNAGRATPRRIEVELVKELMPSAPPPAAVRLAVARPAGPHAPGGTKAASVPASSASNASAAEPQALPEPRVAQAEAPTEPAAPSASVPAEAASAPLSAPSSPASAASAPPLDWPPSTRLTYTLGGIYRNGPLYGAAQVEWLRDGAHYQVRLDVEVKPFFTRRMVSDGRIVDQGLAPTHYDEITESPLAPPRHQQVDFGDEMVRLSTGEVLARWPGMQDQASQFVQFIWMFATHPEWTQPGALLDMPLALPRRAGRWQYDVGAAETLNLPFGPVAALHLEPRAGSLRPRELAVEIWSAPTLQYLPVRIVLRLDADNYIDLMLQKRPLQAAR